MGLYECLLGISSKAERKFLTSKILLNVNCQMGVPEKVVIPCFSMSERRVNPV